MDRPVIVNPPDLPSRSGSPTRSSPEGRSTSGGQIGEGATLVEQFDSAGRIVSAMRRRRRARRSRLARRLHDRDRRVPRLDVGARRGLAPPLRQALPGDGADRRLGADGAGGQGRADGRRGAAGWLTSRTGARARPRAVRGDRRGGRARAPEPAAREGAGRRGPARLVFKGSAQELCQLREGSPTAAPRRRRRSRSRDWAATRSCGPRSRSCATTGYPGSPRGRRRGVRAQRAPSGLGCGSAGAPGGNGRRRLPPDRHQALDLERA